MALLTTEDVLNKKFNYVKFREGYDQVEVDEFLDEVVQTIYALQMENQELKDKLEVAERRVAELSNGEVAQPVAPAVEETVEVAETVEPEVAPAVETPAQTDAASSAAAEASSMLALAQRVHDEYVRDGRKESEQIIAEARAKGDEIVADAQRQHETILTRLEQDRGLLEGKINELRNFESEYRTKLRGHLESLLAEVTDGGEA